MNDNLLEQSGEDQIQIDEDVNYLEELVGEGKKFRSTEDLAKGKYVSDNYIKVLEHRLDALADDYRTLREENIAGPKLQELIDKLDSQQQLQRQQTPPSSNEETKAAYDPKEVESLVSNSILKHEQTRREEENFNIVRNKLEMHYGKNYKDILKKEATALGLSDDDVNSMARRNPNLFSKTFDLDTPRTPQNFQTPPRNISRSDNFAPKTTPQNRTWSYYEEMRKNNPGAWLDKRIALQMEKDAQALGRDFYDI